MGVTYKLKDEIVEFILRQKRENSQISCRKLVIAIHAAFGLNVSKSSINAVIKEANLSSPVGRTPADLNQPKKFSIPKEKKVQLFGDGFPVQDKTSQENPHGTKNSLIHPLKEIVEQKCPASKPPIQFLEIPNSISAQVVEINPTKETEQNISLSPESTESAEVDTRMVLQCDVVDGLEQSQEEKFEIKNTRSFFMRMTYWEFFSKPILEEFFKRHTSLGEKDIRIVDVLACFPIDIFDDPSAALDPQNIWLWKMNGLDTMPLKEEIESIVGFLVATKIPKFDYLLELGYFCSMVSCVKWILSNGEEIFVDGRYMFVESIDDKKFPFCPIERAVEETVRFIDGQEILVLRCLSQENFKDVYLKLCSSLSAHQDKPIKKVVFMGMQNEQLLEFDHVTSKTRHFILSAVMSEGQFHALFGIPLEFVPEQMLGESDDRFNFSDRMVEISVMINEREIRIPVRLVVFEREAGNGEIEVCVTSVPQSAIPPKELEARISRFQEGQITRSVFDGTHYACTGDDSEITIAQALSTLIQMIEDATTDIFNQFGKTEDFIATTSHLLIYMTFSSQSIQIQLKLSEKTESLLGKNIHDIISIYKLRTYDRMRMFLNRHLFII